MLLSRFSYIPTSKHVLLDLMKALILTLLTNLVFDICR
jgi:hypothetical protein